MSHEDETAGSAAEQARPDRADTGMAWGVKASFVNYMAGMPDSRVSLDGGAAMTGSQEFYFPLADASGYDQVARKGTIRFNGTVRFTGHFGVLDLAISEPWLEIDGDTASLSSALAPGHRVPIVEVALGETINDGDVTMWLQAPTRLTVDGDVAFNGVYGVGESCDPVTVRIPA